jgi:hypothetical protein
MFFSSRPLEFVRDACRFARVFARTIEEHPLLVYLSALPFTPTTSPPYQIFHDVDLYPFISGGFQYSWSPLLLVVEHADEVNSRPMGHGSSPVQTIRPSESGIPSRVLTFQKCEVTRNLYGQ